MGERRKRKSMWDVEEETKQFPGISEHDSRDHSVKPFIESNEEESSVNPLKAGFDKTEQNSPGGKEIGGGGGDRYYQNMSPGFDGIEGYNKYKLESDRSDSRRHPRRNRSRSRSNGSPRGRTRSRSPVRDYRNQSEKSFRICREFSAGRCTRGSQCRFLHSENSHIAKDSNFREEKGNRVYESGDVSIDESIGEKNTCSEIQQQVLDEVNGSGIQNGHDPINLTQPDKSKADNPEKISEPKQETALVNSEVDEGNTNNKVMRVFKNSLIEFVKEMLKPAWKEGRLSRDVHKTIVKKVVDKVTSTVQDEHVPKTQEKVDQYLLFSKPKIGKLVQAYVERSVKTDS